jgi:hypothetical protein
MEKQFKVGDRVRHERHGAGTVVSIISLDPAFGVCFDEMTNGHDCQGNCIEGKGWYCYEKDLILIASAAPTPDRAMIAAMAMQGLLATNLFYGQRYEDPAVISVRYADALIAELQKPKQ